MPRWWQIQKRTALGVDALGTARIATSDNRGNEGTIGFDVGKFRGPAQCQCIGNLALEVTVGTFDGAVLVGSTAIVTRCLHPGVLAKPPGALGPIPGGFLAEVPECRRQAVGAVIDRGTAQGPERRLQPGGQGREALTAKNHLPLTRTPTTEAGNDTTCGPAAAWQW